MRNLSSEFKNQQNSGNRNYLKYADFTFEDGTTLSITDGDLWSNGIKFEDSVSQSGSFDIGASIVNKLTLQINNFSGKYTDYTWDGARVVCYIGMELSTGIEKIRICTMIVTDAPYQSTSIISLTCEDYMRKFDRDYSESKLTYPATRLQIVQDACKVCGVTLQSTRFDNDDFIVQERPEDSSITFRQIIAWVAQMGCQWAKCDEYGRLCFGWYDSSDENEINITSNQTNGFTPWLYDLEITGVKVTEHIRDPSKEPDIYQTGSDGYIIEISGNKLIQEGTGEQICKKIAERCIGLKFRPFKTGILTDISLESGDSLTFTDRKGNEYKSYLTSVVLNPGVFEQLECSAKSVSRAKQKQYTLSQQVQAENKKNLKDERTSREKAIEELSQRLSESSGTYTTVETQPDGSNIYYLHNKPLLSESDIVWKMTADAWAVSTDGGKTWNGGMTVDGDVIARILNAEGINADWLRTGRIEIKDDDGNIVFEADIDKKSVTMNPDSVRIGGKTISEALSSTSSMVIQLSDDYQAIPVDAEGNYTTFPSSVRTTATVMYGFNDISKDCTYDVTTSSSVTGSWNKSTRTYTVTGLTADKGWVTIRATYLQSVSVSKTFNLSKSYAGKNGDPGEMYYMRCSANVIKKGSDGLLYPDYITVSGYRSGTGTRPPYAGRFVIEETEDGKTWKKVYTSQQDEAEVNHALYSALATLNGKILTTKEGKFFGVARKFTEIRVSFYAAGGVTQLIDRQNIPLVVDMEALTHEDIFNLLTNNGEIKGIYKEGNQLYINATYIRSLHVTGDQVDAKKLKVVDSSGNVTLYIDEYGDISMRVNSLTIQGNTVADIAGGVATSAANKAESSAVERATTIANEAAASAVSSQTQEAIFNKLTNNGTAKAITLTEDGQLYISFSFAKGGTLVLGGAGNGNGLLSIRDANDNQIGYIDNAGVHFSKGEFSQGVFSGNVTADAGTIAGWKITSTGLCSDSDYIKLLKNGEIVIGDATFSVDSTADNRPNLKYGLRLQTKRAPVDDQGFTTYGTEFVLTGLPSTTSTKTLALEANNNVVGYVSSSSMRYKTIGKTVKEEDLEDLYRIKVVWAKYKDGYLTDQDERCGKEMPMFLAEDIDRRFPLAIDHNEKGKAEDWNYRVMIPCMFAMLKNDHEKALALQVKNQEMQSEIATLKSEVKELKELIKGNFIKKGTT